MGLARKIGRDRRMNSLEQLYFETLPIGCENAITARELEQITGINAREQRNVISNLRKKDGKMIAGGNFGYFIPELDCKTCKAFFQQSESRNRNQSINQKDIADIFKIQLGNFKV